MIRAKQGQYLVHPEEKTTLFDTILQDNTI